jgi:multidrug efflux pump subunit AcrB
LTAIAEKYKWILRKFLENTTMRRFSIVFPVLFLIFGFLVLAPRVGFDLFPGDDNAYSSFTITGPV